MGEDAADVAVQSRKIALKCPSCGAGFKHMAWQSGMVCPQCGSDAIAPAVIIEGAIDYSIADRSKGYAIEDIRFAKLAQWAGFITAYQCNQALAKQKQIADSGAHAPHIAQVLISQKALNELQMKAILEVCEKSRPDADDREFVTVAVQNKFLTKEQGDQIIQAQRDMKKEGKTPPPVSVLLDEKRMMKENQIIAILRAQRNRSVGPIHDAHVVVERHRPPTVLEKYIGKKDDPMRKWRAAAYLSFFTILLLTWAWYYGFLKFRAERIAYYCPKCKDVFIAKMHDTVPIKCPFCGEKAALYGYFCNKCRRAYGVNNRNKAKKCTHCGSMLYSELNEELIEAHRKRMREEREADQQGMRKSDIKIE
ncbi:MAG: hypothetical protein GXP25_11220 [Planctomycetes bacterium]|nr:hypothetical protein [Planctomycetota bacterium]